MLVSDIVYFLGSIKILALSHISTYLSEQEFGQYKYSSHLERKACVAQQFLDIRGKMSDSLIFSTPQVIIFNIFRLCRLSVKRVDTCQYCTLNIIITNCHFYIRTIIFIHGYSKDMCRS